MTMPGWKDLFPVDLAEEGRLSRREFGRFLALVSAGFTVGTGYLWWRRRPLEGAPAGQAQGPEEIKVCKVSDLAPGNSFLFTYRDERDRCILVRTPRDEWRAYRQACTHLGCAVRWDGRKLECPCHNGAFEVEQGFPIQGPPTRALSRLAVEVRPDGWVWIKGDLPKPGDPVQGGAA
jgi:nitrite reductase/ring-hydroxylating ferredoxin subunit